MKINYWMILIAIMFIIAGIKNLMNSGTAIGCIFMVLGIIELIGSFVSKS